MKKNTSLVAIFSLFLAVSGFAQPSSEPTRLFRVYEDNDFLNITGHGTDDSYTNGTRLDLFFTKQHPSHFLLDRVMPHAGDSSVNVFGYGVMQLMVTPNDLSKVYDQPNDYPYSGALVATHTLYSYNPKKTYAVLTELVAGIRGPAALAKQAQTLIHSWINYQKPMGWRNQLGFSPLVNINVTTEKKFIGWRNYAELMGGAQLSGGSMLDAFTFYPYLRIGKLTPYFDGYFSQYTGINTPQHRHNKTQYYAFLRPRTSFVLLNAMVHGDKPDAILAPGEEETASIRRIRHRLENIDFGGVLARGRFSIAYTQTHSTEYNKGLYHHNVGNISLYFSW
jgi:hypothetical protein